MTGIAASLLAFLLDDDAVAILQRTQHAVRPDDDVVGVGKAGLDLLVRIVREAHLDVDTRGAAPVHDERVPFALGSREVFFHLNRLDRRGDDVVLRGREDLGAARHAGAQGDLLWIHEPNLHGEALPLLAGGDFGRYADRVHD